MLDLIIRGGDVVTPQGVAQCDLAIKGETIAAVAAPGTLADSEAARVIDAAGKIVMPGGIDPHVHMQHPFMVPDGTILYTQGPDRVGMAALYGGTTTLIDFAYVTAERSVRAAIEARDADFAPKSCCDWAYHLMLSSEPPHTQFAELAEAIQAGYPTIKIFTTNIWPHRTGRMIDFGDIWETFKVLAKEGGLGVIHAEDNDIVMHMYAKLIREGRAGFENMAEVHNTLSEDLSFRRVLRLAESVPGTALYMMHVSAATGVAAISEARAKGLPIYGESLHQYMLYTAEDYKRPNGQIYHTYPSLKSSEDHKALWAGTRNGAINCVATDELCCTLREKTMGAPHRRHHGRQLRRRAAARRHVHGDGGAARLLAQAVCRSRLHQRRQDHGPLPEERRARRRQRCRHRHPRSGPARQGAQGGPARDRLHAVGGPRHLRLACRDDPARQGRGGERAVPGPRGRRPIPQAQDTGRHHPRARAVSAGSSDLIGELLARSLEAWHVTGDVRREATGALLLTAGDKQLRVSRATGDLPFRWMVSEGERTRGVTSIAGLLRTIRVAVDPGYRPIRLRIAPLPLLPP